MDECPILASNMDTTRTFEMYKVFSKLQMLVIFHKHYTDFRESLDANYYSISCVISEDDWEKTTVLINRLNPYFLTIDIANGYSDKFVDFCKRAREQYPTLTIFDGNVATSDIWFKNC